MASSKPAHFAVIPLPAWGHVRPLLHLSVNLITIHPNLHLTLFLAPSSSGKVKQELESPAFANLHTTKDGAGAIIDRVQIINVSSEALRGRADFVGKEMHAAALEYSQVLPEFVKDLFVPKEQAKESNKFKGLAPSFVLFDFFQSFVPEAMASLLPGLGYSNLPLIGFLPTNAVAMYHYFAAAEHQGFIERYARRQQEEIANGLDPLEAIDKVWFEVDGRVKTLPGLPPMYDYELFSMLGAYIPLPPAAKQHFISIRSAFLHPSVKGVVLPSVAEVEPEAVKALDAETNGKLLMAGCGVIPVLGMTDDTMTFSLQFPESVWRGAKTPRSTSGEEGRVMNFLDEMELKHGKHSVAYVSFGSLFWPENRPELITYLIESLIQHQIPVLFAHASIKARISSELQDLLDHPEVCAVKFAPQWQVLEHDALKFFVSHCGSNSMAEAILSEVPIVSIPFGADQAEISMLMMSTYKVVIELSQVKTFADPTRPKKLYSRPDVIGTEEAIKTEMSEVWGRLDGPEGDEMRANLKKLRATCMASWESGEARRVMTEGFAKFF